MGRKNKRKTLQVKKGARNSFFEKERKRNSNFGLIFSLSLFPHAQQKKIKQAAHPREQQSGRSRQSESSSPR